MFPAGLPCQIREESYKSNRSFSILMTYRVKRNICLKVRVFFTACLSLKDLCTDRLGFACGQADSPHCATLYEKQLCLSDSSKCTANTWQFGHFPSQQWIGLIRFGVLSEAIYCDTVNTNRNKQVKWSYFPSRQVILWPIPWEQLLGCRTDQKPWPSFQKRTVVKLRECQTVSTEWWKNEAHRIVLLHSLP
jgi:hypothetical protein